MLGTDWAPPQMGSTLGEIRQALRAANLDANIAPGEPDDAKTNLRLRGAPLTPYDIDRITSAAFGTRPY